ncbi:hypothetical protein [Oceanidesulfovibrio marinus]|uniref:Uncharacterized protein n=1 Tax=Oceanidesulfovibrio marinus TaxID=370038 RepID=A0ABX6NJ31_9BACT|nr:hypothetical protein [Oceanidesulfovibrio marinus]QJT10211.1 hypothetical protein E8L03_15295 [Oceanidesulfovibrio marinus]
MQGAVLNDLAEHLGVSLGHTSKLCNSETVPTAIRAKLETYEAPTGEHIPDFLLPDGVDRKRGPEKGWLDELRAKAAQAERFISA